MIIICSSESNYETKFQQLICFCFLKHNLKDILLDDAKQQMGFRNVFICFEQTLVMPTKAIMISDLLTFSLYYE